MLAAPVHALKRINWVPAVRPDAHGVSEADLANLIPLNDSVEAPSSAGMTRSAHKAHGRNGHAGRKELFRAEDLWLQWREMRKAGAGLQNLGNTCFMNSVLQSLVHTPPLAELLLSAGSGRLHNGAVNGFYPIQVATELVSRSLAHSTRSPLAPSQFAKSLRRISRSFRLGRQEDAHEFLIALLDAMHEASIAGLSPKPPPEVAHTSFIYRIFGGRMRSQVKCSECGYESNTYDPCIDLSLEITRAHSVARALERFTAGEVLDGQNKYKCPKQSKGVRAVKRMTVDAAPNVLMIQLKRFEFSFSGHKISKKVDFDLELDLAPYMSERPAVPAVYDLYAVLVHSGHSVHSGHYYAYVRAPNGIWHICDDTHVAQVAERQVMAQKAYILFYLKRHPGGRAPPPASTRTAPQPSPAAAPPAQAAGGAKRPAGPAPAPVPQQRRQDVQQAAAAAVVQQQQQNGPSLKRKRQAEAATEAAPAPRPSPQQQQQQQAEQQQRQQPLSPDRGRISKKPRLKGMRRRGDEEGVASPRLPRKRPPPPSPLVGLGGVVLGRRGARLAEMQIISSHPATKKMRRKSSSSAAAAAAAALAEAEAPSPQVSEGGGGSVATSVVTAPDWPPIRQAAAAPSSGSEQQRAVLKQQRRRQRQEHAEGAAAQQQGAAGPVAGAQHQQHQHQHQQPASVQAFLRRASGGNRLALHSWEEAPASVKQQKAALERKELPKRKQADEYDAEYDKGRTKKVRNKAAAGGEDGGGGGGGVDGASFDVAWAAKQRSGVQTELRGSRKRRSADFKQQQQQRGRGRPPGGPRSPGGGQRRSLGGGGRR